MLPQSPDIKQKSVAENTNKIIQRYVDKVDGSKVSDKLGTSIWRGYADNMVLNLSLNYF